MTGPSGERASARELFVRFLERYGTDPAGRDGLDLRSFAREHPELATPLRELLREFQRGASESVLRPGRGATSAASAAAGESGDFTSALLQRLSERGPAAPRYETRDDIARGGQGRIVRVWDEELGRFLAMKLTHEPRDTAQALPKGPRSLGRFLEEARLTAQLDHPGIVPVHELGIDDEGRVFFTMKLVKGRDLKEIYQLVARGAEGWTQTRALSVLLRVCEGMAYAHAKGVIHRDLKPGNVMVGRFGEVYVMDWGLARVLDQPETKDIRVQAPQLTSEVHSLRHGHATADVDDSLYTMDGDVVGTPAYMSPEQAAGDLEAMGPHSDVYSAGAMLYHLYAGHPPYVKPGARHNNYAIWSRVQEGPPAPLHERAPHMPAELIAITEKAMARVPAARYRDMSELADDLRAFLEHRVVHAYETGAVAELRKWVARNRSQAAALGAVLAMALASLAGIGYVQASERADADEQRNRAVQSQQAASLSAQEAQRQELIARSERANVLRLSVFQNLQDLERRAADLWPPRPERVADYEDWLEEARKLVAGLEPDPDPAHANPGHYAQLASLHERALPATDADRAAAIAAHPRRAELDALRERAASQRRALEVSAGRARPEESALAGDLRSLEALQINQRAWFLVDPDRTQFGREAEGLALARLACAHNQDERHPEFVDTLSWALFANGSDAEALQVSRDALAAAAPEKKSVYRTYLARLERAIEYRRAHGPAELAVLERRCRTLEQDLAGPSFAEDEDRWWFAQLAKLIEEIEAFADPLIGLMGAGISPRHGWGITRRLEFARSLEERTCSGTAARARWDEAVASIADPAACPLYAGLVLQPQLGLLPCGRDPRSGLWEFADLQTGEAPERDAQRRLVFDDSTGLVFVLVPGGAFLMGAQREDPNASGYDLLAQPDEAPVHEVEVEPFFLAKFEMTQAQWKRVTGRNPSYYQSPSEPSASDSNPVESVGWEACVAVLRRLGMALPSEVQWEYAARAGTETPWWSGTDLRSLEGRANVQDITAEERAENPQSGATQIRDGFSFHAPVHVGLFNPFGLGGVIGNVSEWCSDAYGPDAYQRGSDESVTEVGDLLERVIRGGNFSMDATVARSARRLSLRQDAEQPSVGLRPARKLEE